MTDLPQDSEVNAGRALEALLGVLRQVLGRDDIEPDDNFFDLGGDSLKAMRAVAVAREVGVFVTLNQLFDNETIEEIADGAEVVPIKDD